MYDIVIPYRHGHQDGIELRFALRSIEKYLPDYRHIFLIGERPDWVQNICWLSAKDTPGRKQFSLMNKLMEVVREPVISEDFIYWHDDHFLLKPTEIKAWYHKTISDALGKASGRYHTAVRNTAKLVGYESPYFDIHVPCMFNKTKLELLYEEDWSEKEYVIKTLYFNKFPEVSEEMPDRKINRPVSKEAIEELIKDRIFFSIGPNGLREQMIKKLNELYPEKSKYESI